MLKGGVYFCNVDGAEIPDGEPTNEFTTTLLAQKGHCHSECLAQRNAILDQYDKTVYALGCLLDPGVDSAPKAQQAAFLEGKRGRPLNRMAKKVHVSALAPKPPKRTRKKVKRAS